MVAPRRTAAERDREAREAERRKTRLSMRLGGLGVLILFLSGLGAWLVTPFILVFLAGMVVGILLILAAFLLVRGYAMRLTREDETKIY
jgi:hypothetical protein